MAHENLPAHGERPGRGHVQEVEAIHVRVRAHGGRAELDDHRRDEETLNGVAERLERGGNADTENRHDHILRLPEEVPHKEGNLELPVNEHEEDGKPDKVRDDRRERNAGNAEFGKNPEPGQEHPVEGNVDDVRHDGRGHVPVRQRLRREDRPVRRAKPHEDEVEGHHGKIRGGPSVLRLGHPEHESGPSGESMEREREHRPHESADGDVREPGGYYPFVPFRAHVLRGHARPCRRKLRHDEVPEHEHRPEHAHRPRGLVGDHRDKQRVRKRGDAARQLFDEHRPRDPQEAQPRRT